VGFVAERKTKAVGLAGSYLITTCATMAAILLFVGLASQVVPAAFAAVPGPNSVHALATALLLNIAIILFGWRRSKDLREALSALDDAERIAHRNANIDHSTGLANRREFMRSLEDAIASKQAGVLMMIDVDHFKRVNDLHGHSAGDELLTSVARILQKTAPQGCCCARIGGDEFAIVLADGTKAQAEKLAEQLIAQLAAPIQVGAYKTKITASIGLATFDSASEEVAILRRSDVALYAAKHAGRNGFAWFNAELEEELASRLALDEDIRRGVEAGEFVPFFQPLVDLDTRKIAGFEALARWRSPTRGLLEPDSFIAQAEATGLIGPLSFSIMEQALTEAKNWPPHLKIAVNISPVQFRESTLAQDILKILTQTGFPARRLELEITEGALLEDREQVMATINSLKAVGVSISLDDFGTGYASLAQLDSLPVDRIKIDRTFITRFVKSERTAAIVDTIATLGHRLNVPLTAEGVESEQIRMELGSLGCSEAQGWLYGRAVSAETVRTFLDVDDEGDAPEPDRQLEPRRGAKF
jgi:diguanylate cyclase (GGDEF)-like protein